MLFALLYADTVLLSQSELDIQKTLKATAVYCMENNMKVNVAQTKVICSREKLDNIPVCLCMIHQLKDFVPSCIWELL